VSDGRHREAKIERGTRLVENTASCLQSCGGYTLEHSSSLRSLIALAWRNTSSSHFTCCKQTKAHAARQYRTQSEEKEGKGQRAQ
jgi:hypothetical protein